MRSAGCIINDIADQDFDRQVARTKIRPLASRSITNYQAMLEALFFLSIGFAVWLFLSSTAKCFSLLGLLLMFMYPFMKRFTNWPQLFLGFAFNFGLIVAITHAGIFSINHFILFVSLILWTIFYDTIYAFADIKDDLEIGVKSTAIVMQKSPKLLLTVCNILIHLVLCAYLRHGIMFFIPISIGFIYLQVLLMKWQVSDSKSCIDTFGNCHLWALALWFWVEFIRVITP